MTIRDNLYDEIYMEVIDVLGRNFDTDISRAAITSEEITEIIQLKVEEELSNVE